MKFLLSLLLGMVPFLSAQETAWHGTEPGGFSVFIELSSLHLTVHEDLVVEVTARYPASYDLDMNRFNQALLRLNAPIRLLFRVLINDVREKKMQDAIEKKIALTLQPLVPGNHSFTLFSLAFIPKDSSLPTVYLVTPVFPLEITLSQLFDKTNLSPAPLLSFSPNYPVEISKENARILSPDPVEQEKETKRTQGLIREKEIPWIGLLALAVALIWGLFPERSKKSALPALARHPTEEARQSLNQLTLPSLDHPQEVGLYFERLSQIVKKYIEQRFHMKAVTETSEEFLREMQANPSLDLNAQEDLKKFITCIDPVKYAQKKPSKQYCEMARQLALTFIISTKM